MDNTNESMLDVYLFETNDLLEHLDEIFRIMHTIKGSSAMMEFNSLTVISHKSEDLFAYVRENGIKHEDIENLFDLMFRCSDFLKAEVGKVQSGEPLTTDIGTFEKEINDFLKKISSAAPSAAKAPAEAALPAQKAPAAAQKEPNGEIIQKELGEGYPCAVKTFFDEEAQMENLRAFMLVNNLHDACDDFRFYPEDIETNSATSNQIMKDGFLIFTKDKAELDKAILVIKSFTYAKNYTVICGEAPAAAPTEKTRSAAGQPGAPTQLKAVPDAEKVHAPVKQSLINVNLSKLDSLMDLMGEIVITESMVTSNPTLQQAGLDNNFTKASRQLRKLTDELQEIVMSIRMVPISTVFQKMNRIVRDMSRKLDKKAQLVLIGEETEVDKTIVDSISDPIMHLVRNAMDHGIETKEKRAQTDKPEGGTVQAARYL